MKKLLVMIVVLLLAVSALQAQESPRITYYIADDAEGIAQVYQLALDGQSEARQLTHAESDVITFGAAYDGLAVAYISGGQLWLQPIHTEEAEALAPVTAEQFFGSPIFSQDGQYLAYPDNGVWLMDLSTRETEQVLENVPLEETASNAQEFRLYSPDVFVPSENGAADKLIVDIGIWEWNTVGVYDLETGELQELEGPFHTDLLVLEDGRVLLYGNSAVAGEPTLDIAESLEDINTYTEVFNHGTLEEGYLFANQAVEIEPGVVRVFGPFISEGAEGAVGLYFDYDLNVDELIGTTVVRLAQEGAMNNVPGQLSPDGSIVPVYINPLWTDAGSIYGEFMLVEMATGETVSAPFPEIVSIFRWQK